MHLIFNILKVC